MWKLTIASSIWMNKKKFKKKIDKLNCICAAQIERVKC